MTPNLSSTVARRFGCLVLVQAVHSVEEYAGRLWETFPPAAYLTGLFPGDQDRTFLLLNIALVMFGAWCLLWPVRRGWPAAVPLMWGWVVLEVINGMGHLGWAALQGGYEPGAATAPFLLGCALLLAASLRAHPRRA